MAPDQPPVSSILLPSDKPSGKPLILLVDDDVVVSSLFKSALTSGGEFEVITASTGEEAIAQLHRYADIQVVVSDIDLPDLQGFDVLRASKTLRPHTPVMLVTGSTNTRFPTRAIREGADEMLIKPVDLAELKSRVVMLAQQARAVRRTQASTVLAIGAHPDDVEIGIAGILLRHVAAGDRVIHLMMTDGESGGEKGERVREAELAAESMGATLVRGSLPDGFLSDARETVNVVANAINKYTPSVVYMHSSHDGHQDHRATYSATMSAARSVPTVCCYQSPSSTVEFCPNRFVDIGAYLDAKIKLINVYASQTATRVYLAEDMIRATARYWGRHAAHHIVEPLEVIRQLTA